jgi:hypothetical protein
MVYITDMEYTDMQAEQYITEIGYRIIETGMDIRGGQMGLNIGENTRIA